MRGTQVDPNIISIIERRRAGEPSVWAWGCEEHGWLTERAKVCPECGGPMEAARGYWDDFGDAEGPSPWFWGLDYIRRGLLLASEREAS